jgi:hypothetical protein
MGWIGCSRCEKFRRGFIARICALMALVRPILRGSSCNNEMFRNAPNVSLGSNGVDRVRSLRKIPTRLHCTNLCISCTNSARFAQSFMQ